MIKPILLLFLRSHRRKKKLSINIRGERESRYMSIIHAEMQILGGEVTAENPLYTQSVLRDVTSSVAERVVSVRHSSLVRQSRD